MSLNDLIAFAHQIAADLKSESKPDTKDELMTRKQVMDYLDIKSTTLHVWQKKGILVPSKVGRKRFYSKSDILALQRGDKPVGS